MPRPRKGPLVGQPLAGHVGKGGFGMTLSVDAATAAFNPELPLAVGLSGGADSTALLVAAVQKWPGQVRAIHVNHGLQAAAAVFEAHCVQLCSALQVPLVVQRVDARHASGQSPEDAARQARYQAFDAALAEKSALGAIKSVALAQPVLTALMWTAHS
eukprot:gene1495-1978_t